MQQIVINGDNLEFLKKYPDNYFDSVVTDPPYGLGKEPDAVELMKDWVEKGYHEIKGTGFMGKEWDAFVPQPLFWKEVFRVLKPGGHVLAFYGTRTYDWGVMAMRFAGFEVRDCIQWIYGSGFPKSHNIGKAIDKIEPRLNMFDDFANYLKEKIKNYEGSKSELTNLFPSKNGNKTGCIWNWENGKAVPTKEQYKILKSVLSLSDEFDDLIDRIENERELIGKDGRTANSSLFPHTINKEWDLTKGNSEWEGWGSALKPANEPIVLARKPLEKGLSIAENVLKWGTGGINIDGSRIGTDEDTSRKKSPLKPNSISYVRNDTPLFGGEGHEGGRFPANVIMDEEAAKILDEQSGDRSSTRIGNTNMGKKNKIMFGGSDSKIEERTSEYRDIGGASRFFYCAKASKSERNKGLEGFEEKTSGSLNFRNPSSSGRSEDAPSVESMGGLTKPNTNFHPTVKPVKLMQYLARLITPPNGIVLDPFCGSGTTGVACKLEGFQFVGIEQDPEYTKIAEARINNWEEEKEEQKTTQTTLF